MSDLSEHLMSTYTEPPIDDPEALDRFVVDDDSKATWCARKLAKYEAEIARMETEAADEVERINAWLADSTSGARRKAEWFAGLLVAYAVRLAEEPDAPKTHKFLGGEVGRRKLPDRVEVSGDEARFVEWAIANDRADLLTIKPRVSEIKGRIGHGFARLTERHWPVGHTAFRVVDSVALFLNQFRRLIGVR